MLGMSRLQLSATLAAVVAGRPPFSLLAAAAPGATGPAQMKLLGAALLLAAPTAACDNWVYCYNNDAYTDENFSVRKEGNPTCYQACGGLTPQWSTGATDVNCCNGQNACLGGRFTVCADPGDGSCSDLEACRYLGGHGGSAGRVADGSCVGFRACWDAGRADTYNPVGRIGNIIGSCRGDHACHLAGYHGNMGDITNSCNVIFGCQQVAWKNPDFGESITDCCSHGERACQETGSSANTWCCPRRTSFGPECGTTPPTTAPTLSPTAAGPLILDYDTVEANFTAGASNELEVGFVVGAGRTVTVEVFETCDKGAERVPSSLFTENVEPSSDPTKSNLTHSKIIVGYNFDKAQMINSSLWNSTSEVLTFCQVTSVTVPDQNGGGSFVVLQDKREIEVEFDLDADFEVDVDLGDRTIRNETEFINFDNDVEAYKCRGGSDNSFSVDDGALPPNTELAICVRVQNNTSVIIDRLAYMVIAQGANLSPNLPMVFINDGNPMLGEGLTKISEASEGVIVKTRLPQGPDYFQFESGLSLNISGTVDLKLATRRKLRALADENTVAGEEREVAEINVVVGVQSTADGFGPIGSSDGHAIVGKGLAAIGLMVLAVTGIVM